MTLHIGIIGTGGFAQKHANMLAAMEDVEVRAICGTNLDKAEHMARDYSNAKGYSALNQMLDGQKLDAVYICVPPFAHGSIELALIERSIPFFVEKPLGMDLETPTSILHAVNEKNLLTSVGYHFRYMDSTQQAKTLLSGRTVGMAVGSWFNGMPKVPWWRKAEGSGGQIIEQSTHIVDLLRYLLGDVTEVYAAFANRVIHQQEKGVTVPDVGALTLKLQSGAVANISNACMLTAKNQVGIQILTDSASLELDSGKIIEYVQGRKTEYKNQSNPYQTENQAFIHALRSGDRSGILSNYADAWKTQQVTVAATRSAETGKPVQLGEEE